MTGRNFDDFEVELFICKIVSSVLTGREKEMLTISLGDRLSKPRAEEKALQRHFQETKILLPKAARLKRSEPRCAVGFQVESSRGISI